jgi:hypothetical protein
MPSKRLAIKPAHYHQILNRAKCPNKPALNLTVPAAHYSIKYSKWRFASASDVAWPPCKQRLGKLYETHMELNTELTGSDSLHSRISFYFLLFLA